MLPGFLHSPGQRFIKILEGRFGGGDSGGGGGGRGDDGGGDDGGGEEGAFHLASKCEKSSRSSKSDNFSRSHLFQLGMKFDHVHDLVIESKNFHRLSQE